jgi:choline dehydrogenase
VLGGSTSVNAMMYVRGNRQNYDAWRTQGADGWGYDDVLPAFKALEDYAGGASEEHGVGGPIPVVDCPDPVMRSEAFMVGATQVGYDGPYWDTNGARQENGAGLLQFHIDAGGRRASAATVFLEPILDRPNLSVETGAHATRVLFEGTRAVGVEYLQGGETKEARASAR